MGKAGSGYCSRPLGYRPEIGATIMVRVVSSGPGDLRDVRP